MKKILILLMCLLVLGGCKAKLLDGKEAVVTFNESEDEGITAEDLYEALKETYGTEYLIDMIDTILLDKEYDETEDEKNYVSQVVASMKDYAEQYGIDYVTYIQSTYGLKTEKEFEEYVALNYRRSAYTEDYAKTTVTDKQIEEYYENYAIGDIKASHILISVDTSSTATDEEKEASEREAKALAEDLIKRLDNGEDFATLAKEYSDDEGSKEDGGNLDYFNRGVMDEAFEEAAVALNVGEYSKSPVLSQFGYHIIYKTDQKEKPTLEDARENIIEVISQELLETNSSTLYIEALENLRNKHKMNITDSSLKSSYEDYMTNLKLGQN